MYDSGQQAFFEGRPELMPLGKLLPWVGSAVTRHYQRAVAAHGLTPTALGVLGVLSHRDGLSHRELAGRLGVTPATLTPVVDALAASGELRRDRDATDRRVVRLWITDTGRDHMLTAFAEVATSMHERLPHPGPEHTKIIRSYLLEVLVALDHEP